MLYITQFKVVIRYTILINIKFNIISNSYINTVILHAIMDFSNSGADTENMKY